MSELKYSAAFDLLRNLLTFADPKDDWILDKDVTAIANALRDAYEKGWSDSETASIERWITHESAKGKP